MPQQTLVTRLKQAIPDRRTLARKIGAGVAAVAAVGAVLGGLTGYWSTYRTVVAELLGYKPAATSRPSPPHEVPRLSIAVLPFDNLSGDAAQDYFSDGIVENLATDLSVSIPNLLVIASASSLTYKGQKIDPRQVGRELNVRYLLQGSVLRTGAQVRINVRLLDAATGTQLWADRLDGDTSNIIALQDQVTARISTLLRVALITAGARQAQTRTNPDAFDMTLRAQAALNDERRLAINPRRQTVDFYRKALVLDPDNVDAEVGLAGVLAENLMNSPMLPPADRPRADQISATRTEITALLQKAARKGDSSEARLAQAHLDFFDRRRDNARKELERALAINPNDSAAMFNLAMNYNLLGTPEKSLPLFNDFYLRTAGRTSSYRAALANWGFSYLLLRRWAEAAEKLEQSRAIFADPGLGGRLAVALNEMGKGEAVREQYAAFQQWYAARNGAQPTIKRMKDDASQFSASSDYLMLYEATVLNGFRKLGMPED